jgi:hypothetical protein
MTGEDLKGIIVPVCGFIGWLVLSFLAIKLVVDWKWYADGTFALLGIAGAVREVPKLISAIKQARATKSKE